MVHFDSAGRPRTAEDEYFWRQDAEICEAVGRAAGGLFGLGALSSDERRHIELIRRDLARPL